MAGAISAGTIASYAALAAMVAGAAIQYQSQTEAQERQQAQIQRSLAAQEELQKRAESKALATAEKFAPKDRLAEQSAISDQIAAELIAPVSDSQAIRAQQQTTQGNVSDDYTTAKATSDANALKNADALARLLGKTTSANRLRMNEGIRLMDTGMDIDRLHNFSKGQQGADAIAIQQAGLVDPGKVFAGQMLSALGSAGMMYGGSASQLGNGVAGNNAAIANGFETLDHAGYNSIASTFDDAGGAAAASGDGGLSSAWLRAFR